MCALSLVSQLLNGSSSLFSPLSKDNQSVALEVNSPTPQSPSWSTNATTAYQLSYNCSTLLSSATTEGLVLFEHHIVNHSNDLLFKSLKGKTVRTSRRTWCSQTCINVCSDWLDLTSM